MADQADSSAIKAQLTWRAVLTGMVIGAILTPCNIYSGLKIGFSFNMSIAAGLISYGFWAAMRVGLKAPAWGIYENNMNQTAASSAASILSAGLVAPIPALTLLTGYQFSYPWLVFWVFTVSVFGVVVAMGIARQMLEREDLPFPNGVATAETLKEMYASGREAILRLWWLGGAALASAMVKLGALVGVLSALKPSFGGFAAPPVLAERGISRLSLSNLGFFLDPSLLLIGFGVIAGWRVAWSLLVGAVVAWLIAAPILLERGWAILPEGVAVDGFWYGPLLEWLLWPGVALMVAAALTSFAISMARILSPKLRGLKQPSNGKTAKIKEQVASCEAVPEHRTIPRRWFLVGLVVTVPLSLFAQGTLFGIPLGLALAAVALTFLLAVVAARVSGETGIPPIGALGKITQVSFAVLAPQNVTTNLMAANVTGGAAGQCSDLLHDLRTGQLIGANVRAQVLAQLAGVLAGSLAGSAAYLLLIDDPQNQLLTEEWPAPAVATWKAVAEVLAVGFEKLPDGAGVAALIAVGIGIALAFVEAKVPRARRNLVPSASAIGFAAILPPAISLAMFLGGVLSAISGRYAVNWRTRFAIVMAAGLVAGESLVGVGDSLLSLLRR